MSAISKASDMLGALRASADGAFRSLSGAPKARSQPKPDFAPLDPTRAFLPGEEPAGEPEGALPLSSLLEESAHAMVRRNDELRGLSRNLAARIEERRNGEITMAAQAVRVVIGLVWLGVAIWLYNAILTARADGLAAIPGGAALADAAVLMQTFLIVAGAGLGVAFGVAALARALGNADNSGVCREAEKLGGAIADATGEFDKTLSALRGAMDRRAHPADAVNDLSRAHLTALEAHAFFREIGFLTGAEDDQSLRQFRTFLGRSVSGGGGGLLDLAITFIAGGAFGALAMHVAIGPEPEPVTQAKSVLSIMQYPWAVQLILAGGLLYAGAGAFLSLFTGPLTEGVAASARADALTALRSGFAAQSALRPADITRRIKDAVDVFRARIGGSSSGRNQSAMANHDPAFSTEEDTPEWRRRDSSVKFVDAGFSAAPERWRTDAYAKKFSSHESRDTAAKRGGEALKNPPRR